MLDWLKRFSGGEGQNKTGLPAEQVKLLAEDLKSLDKPKPELSERALHHVVSEDNEDVLLVLGGLRGGGTALDLICCMHGFRDLGHPPRRKFFKTCTHHDSGLYLRLAKVYEAHRGERNGTSGVRFSPAVPNGCPRSRRMPSDARPSPCG